LHTDLNICIIFLLFAKLGRNSNTVQSELSPIVQWMEFGPSPVTVLLNQNHFQYCDSVLPYIFFNIIDYCYCNINFIWCLIVMLIWADNSKIKVLVLVLLRITSLAMIILLHFVNNSGDRKTGSMCNISLPSSWIQFSIIVVIMSMDKYL